MVSWWRRTGKGLEGGGRILADTAGIIQCFDILKDSVLKAIPPEQQVAVLNVVGPTMASASIAAPLGVLAVLVACRVNADRTSLDERRADDLFRNRVIGHLQSLEGRLQSRVIEMGRGDTSAEAWAKVIRAVVQEAVVEEKTEVALQLNLTAEQIRGLACQMGLLAADIQSLQEKFNLVSDDVRHRPWLELRRPVEGNQHLFLYRDMVIPFVGRDEEWARLTDFMESDRSFSWWRIIDAGGAGKSRLAQELCWDAFGKGWTAGFLNPTAAETWSRWRVDSDTLIVVDYVFARWDPAALGQILDGIARHSGPHRVRFLVLERSDSGAWWRTFSRTAGDQPARDFGHREAAGEPQTVADQSVYGDPLILPPLGQDALYSVLDFVLRDRGIALGGEALKTHVDRFLRLDPKGRPLFAAFYADAVSRDPDRPDWSLAEITRHVIHQKILRCHPEGEGLSPVTVDARHLNLLVLATLIGGVSRDGSLSRRDDIGWEHEPDSLAMADVLAHADLNVWLPCRLQKSTGRWVADWATRQMPLIAGYGGEYDDADPYVPELHPDPLGEALVIERLAGRATAPDEMAADARKATEALLIAAGDLAPRYLSAWIERARQDYPDECTASDLDLRAFQRVAHWEGMPNDAPAFGRLQSLFLWGSDVSDISPLAGLTDLRDLNLPGTKVSDVSALAGLTGLEELGLWDTQVADLSPLKELTALAHLSLRSTPISEIGALALLKGLRTLNLSRTRVSSVSSLKELGLLEEVFLSHTEISNVSPLSGLTALRGVNLCRTEVEDVSPLVPLAALLWLDLSSTRIKSIDLLGKLTELEHLRVSDTQIENISPMSYLTKLKYLEMTGTRVSDWAPLAEMELLSTLILHDTNIEDALPLHKMKLLETLSLSNTGVEDVSKLAHMELLQ
ncbi:MAG: hypothetical protein MH204_08860, partial [Fimbriimonadaceae bacterium]|nr:hypothetical protein [Fimbriimonadaceae bacterium]